MFYDKFHKHGFKDGVRRIANKLGIEFYTLKKRPFGTNHLSDAISMGSLHNPKIIFDIGANIGHTSMQFREVFRGAEIYAFEPVRSTFLELTKNLNGTDVRAVNVGFGEREERKKIFLQNLSELNSLVDALNNANGTGASEEVEIVTLDNFCERKNISSISLLKIDTEGFGLNVLKGANTLLKKGAIESIFIEVGFSEHDKRHDYFFEVFKILSDCSFKLLGFYDQWIEDSKLEYCNAFFVLEKAHV